MKLKQTRISKCVLTAPACYQTLLSLLKKSAQLVCDSPSLNWQIYGYGKSSHHKRAETDQHKEWRRSWSCVPSLGWPRRKAFRKEIQIWFLSNRVPREEMDRHFTVGLMATFQAMRGLIGGPTRDHRTAPVTPTDAVLPSCPVSLETSQSALEQVPRPWQVVRVRLLRLLVRRKVLCQGQSSLGKWGRIALVRPCGFSAQVSVIPTIQDEEET